ncbi:hypothetical protein [Pleionea litopenaei]|uniref:Uncharacterized protein n=1 Tax=Pleionea litopenaei TaxID=3070815 RepID=A0AA51RSF2_9GAMM|nr:hypothetical protein [Pleionea sp. HL-JVS1]WMS86717.1 hypothetical protein Q9312_15965 [Pleionea sp. HL-JVS1]
MQQHNWVTFTKGRIHVTGCAHCGQVLLPTNEHTECFKVSMDDNLLAKKGFRASGYLVTPGSQRVA